MTGARRSPRRSRGIRAAALAGAVAALCAASATGARAATGSQQRAAAATVAVYVRALHAASHNLAAAGRAGTAYVHSTESACSGVLDRVGTLGSGQVNLKASTLVGEEVEYDIESAMFLPLNRIIEEPYMQSIRRLPWTGQNAMLRNAVVADLKASMQPDGSALCADLRTFSANPLAEPPGTAAYFTRVNAQVESEYVTFREFDRTLESFLTSAQHAEFDKASKAFVAVENTLGAPLETLYKQLGTQLGLLVGKGSALSA